MNEPAMAKPNEVEVGADRLVRLRTAVGVGTYHLDGPDAHGAYRLIPATPWEELEPRLRARLDSIDPNGLQPPSPKLEVLLQATTSRTSS
jgi:hypothetical protein